MRILLDQNIPERIDLVLPGHDVTHAFRIGWHDLANGELLSAAENAKFEILLTADQSIRYQQNLAGRKIALIVLSSNSLTVLQQHSDLLRLALERAIDTNYQEIVLPRQPLIRRPWPRPGG